MTGESERARAKRRAIEAGAVEMTVQQWLGLDDHQMQVIEIRIMLGREVRRRREASGLTREALAGRIGVTERRLASIEEAGSGRLDTMLLAYFGAGGDLASLGASIASITLIPPVVTKAAVGQEVGPA